MSDVRARYVISSRVAGSDAGPLASGGTNTWRYLFWRAGGSEFFTPTSRGDRLCFTPHTGARGAQLPAGPACVAHAGGEHTSASVRKLV
jgi:hypothetical protein